VVAFYRLNNTDYTGRFDEELVSALPSSLKFICHTGAGYDNIDPPALKAHNILFSNTPGAVDAPTADVAFFMMLGCFRNFYKAMQHTRRGEWRGDTGLSHDPENKVLGVLGMGGIGRALAKRAAAFDMEIIYHNRRRLPVEEEAGARWVSFEELLAKSDCLSLNLPLNKNTRHIISHEEIAKCKKGVIIINTARGPVLDEQALVDGLASGQVGNAGLDVFEKEPEIHPELLKNDKVFLLPHIGTGTFESQYNMEMVVINNLKSALTRGVLNTPIAELKEIADVHKLN
jgi:lactate dehydrogenase-like 2-hydroxyacid dehydrogenase